MYNLFQHNESPNLNSSKLSSAYNYASLQTQRWNQAIKLPEGPELTEEQLEMVESQFKVCLFFLAFVYLQVLLKLFLIFHHVSIPTLEFFSISFFHNQPSFQILLIFIWMKQYDINYTLLSFYYRVAILWWQRKMQIWWSIPQFGELMESLYYKNSKHLKKIVKCFTETYRRSVFFSFVRFVSRLDCAPRVLIPLGSKPSSRRRPRLTSKWGELAELRWLML